MRPGPKRRQGGTTDLAETHGICIRAARQIANSGYTAEGMAVLIEQARRAAENRRAGMRLGDYRKTKSPQSVVPDGKSRGGVA